MYHERRMFGGGLASSYLAAALALQGSVGFEERFNSALVKARRLFKGLDQLPGINVTELDNGSNIFRVAVDDSIEARLVGKLRERDVFIYPLEGADRVTTLTVNTTVLRWSDSELLGAFRDALSDL